MAHMRRLLIPLLSLGAADPSPPQQWARPGVTSNALLMRQAADIAHPGIALSLCRPFCLRAIWRLLSLNLVPPIIIPGG